MAKEREDRQLRPGTGFWIEDSPDGLRTVGDMSITIVSMFLDTVAGNSDRVALIDSSRGTLLSYGEYLRKASLVAGGLRSNNLGRGERVLLMMSNRPEFHYVDLGVMLAGGVPVSVYNTSSPQEIGHIAQDSGATFMILENKTMLDVWLKSSESRDLQTYVIDRGDTSGFKHLEDLLSGETLDPREAASEIVPEDLATIIYTSGTTGPPKGVMLSHENVLSTVLQLVDAAAMSLTPGRRTVSYLPMAHIAERMMSHYQPMLMAYEVSCCGDANLLPETLRESRPQILFGVPRVWEKIKSKVESIADLDPDRSKALREAVQTASDIKQRERDGELREDDLATLEFLDDVAFKTVRELVGLDSLEYAVSGAASLPVDVLRWFEAIGVPMSEIYGMSESSGPMTWSPRANKPGYVGSVIPKGEIKIAEDGEILYRGPNVFVGYWGDTAKTEEVLKDGWLMSGDVGEIDVDGYLRIVDRKKELIITSGGKNISPSNLESEIRGIPLVGQAAVIGDNRPYCVCLVSLDPEYLEAWSHRHNLSVSEALESAELHAEISRGVDSVNERFSRVEQIKKFVIVREFWTPGDDILTPTSKIKRRGVLSRYRDEIEEMYK